MIILSLCLLFCLALCPACHHGDSQAREGEKDLPIIILHDNDVHCGAEGYVSFAGLRDAIIAADTAFVLTVSSGDFLQGEFIGNYSQGSYLIDIMKSVNFDAVTLGNHEFDYGLVRQQELLGLLGNDKVTCSNFIHTDTRQSVYRPYILKTCGTEKIAFVGAVTPGTVRSEYYAFYEGGKPLPYDIPETDAVSLIQSAVNDARSNGADYVILLSHLGELVDQDTDIYSIPLINQTSGIDAVLDGHTHSVIQERFVKNSEGRDIPLTQTGTKFSHFGKVTISTSGLFHTECIPDSLMKGYSSPRVRQIVDSVNALCSSVRMEKVGHTSFELTVNDENGKRLVRKGETNLANLVCDAFLHCGGTQISFMNGGGIRASIPAGDITFGGVVDATPFGNELVNIKITGKQIAEVLESAFKVYPEESGGYLHTGGLSFTYDAAATPHIRDLKLLRQDGTSVPLSESTVYKATATTYIVDDTVSYPAFEGCPRIRGEYITEYNALKKYILDIGGEIPERYRTSQNRVTIK